MVRRITCLFLLVLLIEVAGCGRDAPAQAKRADSAAELKAHLATALSEGDIPSAAFVVVHADGRVEQGAVGQADRASGRAAQPTTVYRIGSITKTFVAMAIMHASERGIVALNEPIESESALFAPNNDWAQTSPITLAHLLEHSAGLDDMHPNEIQRHSDQSPSLSAALSLHPESRAARWPPGQYFAYANPGYTVAAYILEQAAGVPYEAYLRTHILMPLGMPSCTFQMDAPPADEALGYTEGGTARAAPITLLHRPAGEMACSIADLGKLVQFWLSRGASAPGVLSRASLERMERSETLAPTGLDGHYGLGLRTWIFGPYLLTGHDGVLPGFTSSFAYSIEHGVGWAIAINRDGSRQRLSVLEKELAMFVMPAEPVELPPPHPQSRTHMAKLEGQYRRVNHRFATTQFLDDLLGGASIVLSENNLTFREPFRRRRVLVATADDHFRFEDERHARFAFDLREDGSAMLRSPSAVYVRSGWLTWLRMLIAGALIAMGSALLFAPYWTVRSLVSTGYRATFRRGLHGPPLIATLSFVAMVLFASALSVENAGQMGAYSAGFTVSSALFAVLSLASAVLVGVHIRRRRPRFWAAAHATVVTVACLTVAGYLSAHGIIGLRTWAV